MLYDNYTHWVSELGKSHFKDVWVSNLGKPRQVVKEYIITEEYARKCLFGKIDECVYSGPGCLLGHQAYAIKKLFK